MTYVSALIDKPHREKHLRIAEVTASVKEFSAFLDSVSIPHDLIVYSGYRFDGTYVIDFKPP
ncbi:MAG: hypothetical protein ACPGRX_07975, partial [Bdellovibrionales bacterium]